MTGRDRSPGEDGFGRRDPAAIERLLLERTRRLAAAPQRQESIQAALPLLVFTLGGERYGIGAGAVLEVLAHRELTPLPGLPPHIAGALAYRGEVLPAFDLRRIFNLPTDEMAGWLVIAGFDKPEMALVAESIEAVEIVDEAAIRPVEAAGEALVRGLARDRILVLDTPRLFEDPRLFFS